MNPLHLVSAALFRAQVRGSTRFHNVICGGRRIGVKTKHGVSLSLSPREYVDALIIRNGYYEEEVLDALLTNIKAGDVFWDIGANLGIHALTVKKLRPEVTSFAFEPNPSMAELVRGAALRNRIDVGVIELALDNEEGAAVFYIHEGNAGRSGLTNWENNPQLGRIEVNRAMGDQIIERKQVAAPTIIKMDVEGNELRTLTGMERLLAGGSIHTIVFENSRDENSPAKVLLEKWGYRVQALSRKEDTAHDLENFIAKKA